MKSEEEIREQIDKLVAWADEVDGKSELDTRFAYHARREADALTWVVRSWIKPLSDLQYSRQKAEKQILHLNHINDWLNKHA